MADEEPGFTFVDRRRVQAEEAAGEPAVEIAEEDSKEEDSKEEDLEETFGDDQAAPNIYGVLGYCISLLASEAWHKLGLLADPKTGEAVADLAQAKVAIDAIGGLAAHLEAAPPEAVPDELRRDLKTLLNDLRLNYVAQRGDSAASRN